LRTEHAIYQRFFTTAAWAVLGVCAGLVAWQRFRHGLLVRALSARLLDLLGPADWWWIAGAGAALPLAWHALVTRFTPWTALEWSLGGSGLLQAAGQTTAMLGLLLLWPLLVAAWRLGKAGRIFGLHRGLARHGLTKLAVACAALALPAFGLEMWEAYGSGESVVLLPVVLLGIAVAWWLLLLAAGLLGRRATALRRAVLFRAVLPAWGVAMLLLGLSLVVCELEERRWAARDRVLRRSTAVPSMSWHEAECARWFREELEALVKECQK
jgi:hypothetical protein